jgi:serine phosphatase RsbU (regulator of sigma subunit)
MSAEAGDMNVPGSASTPAHATISPAPGAGPAGASGLTGLATAGAAGLPSAPREEPFGRVTRLAELVLGVPLASVTFAGERAPWHTGLPTGDMAGGLGAAQQFWCRRVVDSQERLIIDDARLDPWVSSGGPEPASVLAWAGFPVRDPAGYVVGALCAADHLPRTWSAGDVEILEALAQIAAREVALQAALEHGAERAELAQTLQESLLPPRLPEIPGLEVAARYVAGGTGTEVLGDFFDVFPSVRGSWGMVVGDVCGKGVPAAKSTALARYTLRAEAHRETLPSLILAVLNQALLDWLTDDPRFLSAIYATVRPTRSGASVQISSAGHPLALLHRADGRVQQFGRPGTLLGLIPDPELSDSQRLLRAGDSLILFTDGVTEARSPDDRDFYGEDRLRDCVAGLGGASAARMADAVQHAVMAFSGGDISDDTAVLVLKIPPPEVNGPSAPSTSERLFLGPVRGRGAAGRPVEEPQQFHWQGHDQGAAALGGDLGHGLPEPQLQSARAGGHDGSGLGEPG